MSIRTKIGATLLAAAFGLTGGGCAKNDSGVSEEEHRTVSLQMNVGTRAASDTDEGMASEREVVSLRVYAFDGEEPAGYYYTDAPSFGTDGTFTFVMDVKVRTTGTSQTLDFYVIANEHAVTFPSDFPGFSASTTLAELKECYFTEIEHVAEGEHATPHLPMAAVRRQVEIALDGDGTESTEPGHEGHLPTGTTVDLTLERAVARLGVYLAKAPDNDGTLFLQGLTLQPDGRRRRNYCLPPDETRLQAGGWENLPFSIFSGDREITAVTTVGDTDPAHYDTGNHPYYLFENLYGSDNPDAPQDAGYQNGTYRGNILSVDYTVAGEAKQKSVYLPAIERNCFYKVFCTVETGGAVTVTYTVADWDDEETALEVDYPTYTCAPLDADDYSTDVYYSADNELEGAFCLQFTMTQPAGRNWVPSVSGGDYKLRIFSSTEEITDDNTRWVSSENEVYRIYVVPTRQYDAASPNPDGLLRIAAPTWENQDDLLLINRNFEWNAAETEENRSVSYIRIKQVPPPLNGNG